MPVERRRRGFERAGRLPAEQLGLPRARATELLLSTVWRRVAGEAIARRAPARSVRRGVLEIVIDDERWFRTLKPLIPRLAGRLSASCPELGVRKLRLLRDGHHRAAPPTPVAPEPAGESTRPGIEPPAESESPSRVEDPADRLGRAMERYLERSARRPPAAGEDRR